MWVVYAMLNLSKQFPLPSKSRDQVQNQHWRQYTFLTISGVHNSLKRFFQGMIFFWWGSAPLRLHHIKKLEKFIARFSGKLGKTSKNGVFHHFSVPKPKSKSEIENRALWRLLESQSESSCKISEKSLWSILRSGKWRTHTRTIFCLVKLNFWEVENC